MTKIIGTFVFAVVMFVTSVALAEDKKSEITVTHPWAVESAPDQKNAAVYMTVENHGKHHDVLLSVSGDMADKVELHSMKHEKGVMKMEVMEKGLEIKASKKAILKTGGNHIMLMGLKKPLVKGEEFPLTLNFEKAGKVEVKVKVEANKTKGQKPKAAEHKAEDHKAGDHKGKEEPKTSY